MYDDTSQTSLVTKRRQESAIYTIVTDFDNGRIEYALRPVFSCLMPTPPETFVYITKPQTAEVSSREVHALSIQQNDLA